MSDIDAKQIQRGSLLIASPEIENGIFFRSVILICEHSLTGSFGLIINKPIDFEIGDSILEVEDLANPKVDLRAGGPIQMNQMMILHSTDEADSKLISKGVYLGGSIDFLHGALSDPEGPETLLLFGYASWAAGLLEREFLNGQWYVADCKKEYLFDTPVDEIWRRALMEKGGKYASLSMIPDDLSQN